MLDGASILVADDEEIMREILYSLLSREGCLVRMAKDGESALETAKKESFDAVLLDVMMPGMNGLDALAALKKFDSDLPVIMITAFGTASNIHDAWKRGAFDFVEKPFKNDDVLVVIRNAVEQRRLVTENRVLRKNLEAKTNRYGEIIGQSPRIQRVFDLISQAAPSRTTILVTGESGTGKELVARAIHMNSPRSAKPFITVNSGSLPPDLLESNLFGHLKGAFTGAIAPKKGLFELADKGSIFFDEIGTVPLETQAKLLRVIQEREFMRLGGVDTVKVDVRIIAATNVDLQKMVEEGSFREDLYYRLHVITIDLPSLRDRREDVRLLAHNFLHQYGKENQKTNLVFSPEVLQCLEDYHWPGNVRELENVIERAVVLASSTKIGIELIPDELKTSESFQLPNFDIPTEGIPFRKIIEEMETRLVLRALEVSEGVQKRAAELLQIKPTTLNEMIKRYGIPTRRARFSRDDINEVREHKPTDQAEGNVDRASSDIFEVINERLRKH